MPEEIFQLWFDGRIKANGWPPNSSGWCGALREYSFAFWTELRWSKETLILGQKRFTAKTHEIVEGLIAANFHGAHNLYSSYMGDESKLRIKNILEFIKTQHRMPGALIFIEDNDELELVDGCHRLATLAELKRKEVSDAMITTQVDAWIGRIVSD